jgi:hypothetical protein
MLCRSASSFKVMQKQLLFSRSLAGLSDPSFSPAVRGADVSGVLVFTISFSLTWVVIARDGGVHSDRLTNIPRICARRTFLKNGMPGQIVSGGFG